MTEHPRSRRLRRSRRRPLGLGVAAALICAGLTTGAPGTAAATVVDPVIVSPIAELPGGLTPVDPQRVHDLNSLTWDDFVPVPNTNWADPNLQPTIKKWRAALVMADFPDRPFNVTEAPGATVFGNPGPEAANIPREDVPQFYHDLLNTPNALNRGHTLNEYWMENTGGRYGVEVFAYGPYLMPYNGYQYFYQSYGNSGPPQTDCPAAMACTRNFRTDAAAAWLADTGLRPTNFDNVFYVASGLSQSSVWLEFGMMMFKTKEDVPDSFGPPQAWKDAVAALGYTPVNYTPTRYVEWTSWAATSQLWANASGNTSIESEGHGAGTYAHEFSHNLRLPDNYGNPYAATPIRDSSGTWDMMNRGNQNGPLGAHTRWMVPSVSGDVMGSQHMLRDKMFLNIIDPTSVVNVTRSSLATTGVLSTSVTARAVQLPGQKVGINIQLDGTTATGGGDQNTCASTGRTGDRQWLCDANSLTGARGNYNNYTLEVVDRMGSDSYQPDYGVLIAKTKNSATPNKWVIDANEADINLVDYYEADGTPVMYSRGSAQQLTDALFKAGNDSGSTFEFVDPDNKLHFYVLDTRRDADGILSYDLAVRNTDGSGPQARGVALGAASVSGFTAGEVVRCTIGLTNTGASVSDALFNGDVYRLSASVDGAGWTTWLPHQVAGAGVGETTDVVVYGVRSAAAEHAATITLTATSESDATKSASADCAVTTTDTSTPGNGVQVITTDASSGSLTLNTPVNQVIVLNPVALTGLDQITSGSLNPVQVADARGTSAGWTLTGQATDLIAGTGSILADNLGWRPNALVVPGSLPTSTPGSVAAGDVAVPGSGLGSPKTLCSSPAGASNGVFRCSGGLDLGIPGSTTVGTFSGLVTLTLI